MCIAALHSSISGQWWSRMEIYIWVYRLSHEKSNNHHFKLREGLLGNCGDYHMGVEPKIGGFYPQNGWFIMEHPINMGCFGGKHPYFWKRPYLLSAIQWDPWDWDFPKSTGRLLTFWYSLSAWRQGLGWQSERFFWISWGKSWRRILEKKGHISI